MPKSDQNTTAVIPGELPPCDGPKLAQFQYHDSPIQWLEKLETVDSDTNSSDGSSTTGQGHVFRAVINKREYAIKVVCTAKEGFRSMFFYSY